MPLALTIVPFRGAERRAIARNAVEAHLIWIVNILLKLVLRLRYASLRTE